MKTIPLTSIRIDGGTQSRAALNDEAVADYAAIIRDGTDFPPVVVFHDGKDYWLADGFHRWHAYRQAGAVEIASDVRTGTKRDAVLFSVGANTDHGLRRTNADKRSAVMVLLGDEEWSKWSDREIARRAGVSNNFVSSLRSSLSSDDSDRTYTTKHGTTATMNTAGIGKPADVPPEVEAEARRVKAEQKAELDRKQAENDAAREKARAALPDSIKRAEAAKAKNGSAHAAVSGLTQEQRIAELEEAVRVLEAENEQLRADNAKLEAMRVEYEQGGFEVVIAGRDERIRVLQRQVETESADKLAWKRKLDAMRKDRDEWKQRAIDAGYVDEVEIPINGEAFHG